MYKLIILSAVFAVAAGIPFPVAPGLISTVGLGPLAVAPPTIVNSPAGAVRNTIANQVLSGVTAQQAALTAAALSNPLAYNAILGYPVAGVYGANRLGLGGLGLAGHGLGLGGLGLAGHGLGHGGARVVVG